MTYSAATMAQAQQSFPFTLEVSQTYGQVMLPLVWELLPKRMRDLADRLPVVKEWILLSDKVSRAEKISCFLDWTPEESEAYQKGNTELFSRLRGYSEDEISDYKRYLKLTEEVTSLLGLDECEGMSFVLDELTSTSTKESIDEALSRRVNLRGRLVGS